MITTKNNDLKILKSVIEQRIIAELGDIFCQFVTTSDPFKVHILICPTVHFKILISAAIMQDFYLQWIIFFCDMDTFT